MELVASNNPIGFVNGDVLLCAVTVALPVDVVKSLCAESKGRSVVVKRGIFARERDVVLSNCAVLVGSLVTVLLLNVEVKCTNGSFIFTVMADGKDTPNGSLCERINVLLWCKESARPDGAKWGLGNNGG